MLDDVLYNQCQLDPNLPIVAGISGGPDSLCLLDVLHTTGYKVIVAHFNHKLRPEADLECESVTRQAQAMGLSFVTDSAEVGKWAHEQGISIEDAARTLRYRFLFAAARKHNAQAVAVGHTADDQVETILMHFLRGAGLAGLKGMEPKVVIPLFDKNIPLVRPLLSLWRVDTESYCRDHRLEVQIDATNEDVTYFRNRLRHTLIPELEKYNPRFKETLIHTGLALQGDYNLLQSYLDTKWEEIVLACGATWVQFDQSLLTVCQPSLQRRLFQRAGEMLRPNSRDIGFEALERASVFARSPNQKRVDFINGLFLTAENGRIYLAAQEADLPFGDFPTVQEKKEIEIGSQHPIGNGWIITSDIYPSKPGFWSQNANPWTAWLDAGRIGKKMHIRHRCEGDTFQPLGMGGQIVKVKEFFINNKIPVRARNNWPLICAGEDIVWIPGYRISDRYKVDQESQQVLRLQIRKE